MRMQAENFEDFGFTVWKEHVQPDGRGRLALDPTLANPGYRMLVNDAGQVLLDPVAGVPANEARLRDDAALRAPMRRALQQAAEGDFHDLGSFAHHADEEDAAR